MRDRIVSSWHSIIKICKGLGLDVVERAIPREMLYLADEAFFTGKAAEITPIRSVDKRSLHRASCLQFSLNNHLPVILLYVAWTKIR